jgi:hypothetical protein
MLVFKHLKLKSKLEFFDIHISEKGTTCSDCRGFKWQNINILKILIGYA